MMKKRTCKISGILLSAVMAMSCSINCFAQNEDAELTAAATASSTVTDIKAAKETAEKLISESVVVKAGESYYYKKGEKTYFNKGNESYFPKSENEDISLTANVLAAMFDAQRYYNSVTETTTFKKGDTVVTIRTGEDAIYTNGVGKYITNLAKNNGTVTVMPMTTVAQALGYSVKTDGKIYILSEGEVPGLDSKLLFGLADELFSDYYFATGFEDGESEMNFVDWGYRDIYSPEIAEDASGAFEGDRYAVLPASSGSYVGYQTEKLPAVVAKKTMEVSFYAKKSADYKGNTLKVSADLCRDDDLLVQTPFSVDPGNELSEEWQKMTFRMSYRYTDDNSWEPGTGYNLFAINIITSSDADVSEDNPATGEVYIDNVTLKFIDPVKEGCVSAEFVLDSEFSIYELGKTMKYTALHPEDIEPFVTITANIYDMDEKLVTTETKTKDEVLKGGFTFTPDQPGFYEIELIGKNQDGDTYYLAEMYDAGYASVQPSCAPSRRHGFLFTRGTAKPMAQRNDRLMVSSSGNYEEVYAAKELGFSGVRIHTVKWANGRSNNKYDAMGFEGQKRGVYNWRRPDEQINNCYNLGFKRIVPNIQGTPNWAVKEEYRDLMGTPVGGWEYSVYAAEKDEYIVEAMEAFLNRYHDKITGIEWYNEPYYGNARTAFWYDTEENFTRTTVAAFKTIKKNYPELETWSAGHLGDNVGVYFATDMMRNKTYGEDLKKYTDVISIHGRYAHPMVEMIAAMDANGWGDKKVVNSEAYNFAGYRVGNKFDYKTKSMQYLMHDMVNIKLGTDANAYFQVGAYNNAYMEAKTSDFATWGCFRAFGRNEFYGGSSVIYSWNKLMGKECKLEGEYQFGDVRGVRFTMDGEPLVVFWNTKDSDFAMPNELKGLLNGNTTLYDYELKDNIDPDNLMHKKMYYIVGADEKELNKLSYTNDAALDTEYLAPHYTAVREEKVIPDLEDFDESFVKYENKSAKPFNEKTFELNEDIDWITSDWKWCARKAGAQAPEGYDVRHAVHLDKDGLYIVVDVTDPIFYQTGTSAESGRLWQGDSIQFAFNASLETNQKGKFEAQLALTDEGVLLYKQACQDVGAMLPEQFTKASTIMPSEYSHVEKTDKGLLYCVFIPASELFPYAYPGPRNYFRVSILTNNTDDDSGSQGYFEWGSGIGGTKEVNDYAVLVLPEWEQAKANK